MEDVLYIGTYVDDSGESDFIVMAGHDQMEMSAVEQAFKNEYREMTGLDEDNDDDSIPYINITKVWEAPDVEGGMQKITFKK